MSQVNQRRIVAETGRVFTFTIGNVKQFSFQSTLESAESAEKLSGIFVQKPSASGILSRVPSCGDLGFVLYRTGSEPSDPTHPEPKTKVGSSYDL